MDHQKIAKIDNAIIQAAKKINVLKVLAWPAGVEEKFLDDWNRGNPQLPKIHPAPPDLSSNVAELQDLMNMCDQNDPVEKFLAETALSYFNAGHMLMAMGTTDFTRYATKIYGRPDTPYKFQDFTAIESAQFLLDVTEKLLGNHHIQPTVNDIPHAQFSEWLKTECDEFFEHDVVEVVVDPGISAKALAGATRIRVRGNTMFSSLDKDQLLFHEAYIHTATQLKWTEANEPEMPGHRCSANDAHAGRDCSTRRVDHQCNGYCKITENCLAGNCGEDGARRR